MMRRVFSFLRPRTRNCDGEADQENRPFAQLAAGFAAISNANIDFEKLKE